MLFSRIDAIHSIFLERIKGSQATCCVAFDEDGDGLRPFDDDEEEQKFIDKYF